MRAEKVRRDHEKAERTRLETSRIMCVLIFCVSWLIYSNYCNAHEMIDLEFT